MGKDDAPNSIEGLVGVSHGIVSFTPVSPCWSPAWSDPRWLLTFSPIFRHLLHSAAPRPITHLNTRSSTVEVTHEMGIESNDSMPGVPCFGAAPRLIAVATMSRVPNHNVGVVGALLHAVSCARHGCESFTSHFLSSNRLLLLRMEHLSTQKRPQ